MSDNTYEDYIDLAEAALSELDSRPDLRAGVYAVLAVAAAVREFDEDMGVHIAHNMESMFGILEKATE